MTDPDFIAPDSIVRRIWSDPNVVLFTFAGAAAEFALNRAVDWLFFTNRLPNDPIGRLFSTVRYAQRIVFASESEAQQTLSYINRIHADLETRRGQRIPEWAFRDVLYMLIHYSLRAHDLLHGALTPGQREESYLEFLKLGRGLLVQQLPSTYTQWRLDRERRLAEDLAYSDYTRRLFEQYRRHLGPLRYRMLLELQALLAPRRVRELLNLRAKRMLLTPWLHAYSLLAQTGMDVHVQRALMPDAYHGELEALRNRPSAALRPT